MDAKLLILLRIARNDGYLLDSGGGLGHITHPVAGKHSIDGPNRPRIQSDPQALY